MKISSNAYRIKSQLFSPTIRVMNSHPCSPSSLCGTSSSFHASLRRLLIALQIGHGHRWVAAWSLRPATLAFYILPAWLSPNLPPKAQLKTYQSLRRPPVLLGCQEFSFLCCSHFSSLGLLTELPWWASISLLNQAAHSLCQDHVSCLPVFSAEPFMAPQ